MHFLGLKKASRENRPDAFSGGEKKASRKNHPDAFLRRLKNASGWFKSKEANGQTVQ